MWEGSAFADPFYFYTKIMDAELKRRLDRIDEKLTTLLGRKKETWVGPRWLTKLTGWNNEDLRQAREQNIVEYKASEGGGWLYRLESVPEAFIKYSRNEG